MASVWIPAPLRSLTAGHERVTVAGRTVGQVIDALDCVYPGIGERICPGGRLSLQVWVDGRVALLGLKEPLAKESEVLLLPAVAGG